MEAVGHVDVQEDRVMAKLVRNGPKYMRYVSMTLDNVLVDFDIISTKANKRGCSFRIDYQWRSNGAVTVHIKVRQQTLELFVCVLIKLGVHRTDCLLASLLVEDLRSIPLPEVQYH